MTIVADRVRESTSTTGTGALTLTGATAGCRTFNSAIGTATPCYYLLVDANGTAWETGIGQLSDATHFTRTTVQKSSNSNSAINLSAGTHLLCCALTEGWASSLKGPAFSAKWTSTGSMSNVTWTKMTWATENFDTDNNFTSDRFTPTVAGYYQINASIYFYPALTGGVHIALYKNGSNYISAGPIPNSNQGPAIHVAAVMYLNGSTDYAEVFGYQDSGGSLTYGANDFSGVFIRA